MSGFPPVLVILGGINGAGKSTLAGMLSTESWAEDLVFLDPDRIAAGLRNARPELTLDAANFAALRIVSGRTLDLLASRRSFVTETVLASASHRKLCEQATASGWIVRLIYIGVPRVEDSIARVALRVSKGGHDVPETDIRRRWLRTHDNLAWFARHAGRVDVYANAIWGEPPILVARARAGRVEILDPDTLPAVTAVLRPLL